MNLIKNINLYNMVLFTFTNRIGINFEVSNITKTVI